MAQFRVRVPFTEHDNARGPRRFVTAFELEAKTWLDAMEAAVERFEAENHQDYHSWVCEVLRDQVEVVDLGDGRTFRIDDLQTHDVEPAPDNPGPDSAATDSPTIPYSDLLQLLDDNGPDLKITGAVLELAMHAVTAESGSVLLIDAAKGDLFFQESRGPKAEEIRRFRLDMGVGIAGWCAQRGEAMAVFDAPGHPRFYKGIGREIGYETRSIVCAPIRSGRTTLGVLEVLNVKMLRPPPEHIAFVSGCARLLALALRQSADHRSR